MKRTKIIDVLQSTDFNQEVLVKGWVRTHRSSKAVHFIALNDGSTIKNVQIVVDPETIDPETLKNITTGACLCVSGTLVESQGQGQTVEIQGKEIEIYGLCGSDYPMQKKGQSFEYMRQHAHLRLRTNTFGAVMRIRHNMAIAIHKYFHDHGYFYFHTPIITASDAEGAGEMFQVTTQDLNNLPHDEQGKVKYDDDFFGKMTSLTVSGQLEGELGATALGQIYTFGPTFRAENSNTPRHLAEFWMIEPEIAFTDLDDLMGIEEEFIKYCVQWALDNCKDDLEFLNKMIDKTLLTRLQSVVNGSFVRLDYSEGIKILEEAVKSGQKFEYPVSWGMDLASEHERYLVEHHFKKPVIMYNYPKEIKAFYMKINEDGKTVQGTDVLFPQIGEIIGGSVREESYEKLLGEIERRHIPMKDMWWYLDTRKFGSCPHGGFGLGFERLILFVTGMQNIRDVIPFPRTPKSAEF
ncbi:asparagine--tRNA ligase [Hoylesella timonensis]|uniref:Asparagine--tRNA ligase n=1 Tax=Hoylesella timonensis S9-PR14 TaxID=1401062 RepID=A0A098YTR2_9BACT|nr:asparagine--tRNA ligase [Hoylesella timonensis]KGI23080.1 asparaginyl-tRNA synthetase [Hoylesella timonensis S9-PR14]